MQIDAYTSLYGGVLPEYAGDYYCCRNCGTIKTTIQERNYDQNPLSLAHTNLVFDVSSGNIFCGSAFQTSAMPDYSSSKDPRRKMIIRENRDDIKKVVTYKCIHENLSVINLIGKIVATSNSGAVIVCPHCAILTCLTREGTNSGDDVFSCGCLL